MTIKVWVIDKKTEKYKKIILKKARLVASFLALDGYLEIFLVGNRQMKKNILSYVGKETRGEFIRPDIKEKNLGEIYLNPFYIKKQHANSALPDFVLQQHERAHTNDEKFQTSLLFMLFHGLLHIAGYDHKRKNDRINMEKKETELLHKFLIPSGRD